MRILNVVGLRPNCVKKAPLARCLEKRGISHNLVHTGQHYDDSMSKDFFEDLQLPKPDIYLGVDSVYYAALVLTDSGELQEETTYLGIPCINLGENTERPITLTEGTNVFAGSDPRRNLDAARTALNGPPESSRVAKLWDGKTAPQMVAESDAR